jgi:hypothetical protein
MVDGELAESVGVQAVGAGVADIDDDVFTRDPAAVYQAAMFDGRALSSLKGRGLSTGCRPVVLLAFGLRVGSIG